MLRYQTALLSMLLLSVFAGCSKVEDMHTATMHMNDTTTDLAGVSAQMNRVMSEIYDSGRQGASLDLRNKLFDVVANAPKVEEKGANAGLYFLAFEFQLWSNLGQDNLKAERERLMKDAVDEFFCHLLSLTHWQGVDPFAGKNPLAFGESDNERAAFNAFALTLERNNRKQEVATKENGVEEVSMRNMIENALLADQKIKSGEARLEDYPAYIDIVRQHEELAIRLLQARYQMMGIAVLTQFTPIAQSTWEGFKYKIWGKTWDLNFSTLNSSELRLASFRLREALRARAVLEKIGVKVELDSSVRAIFENAERRTRNFSAKNLRSDAQATAEDFSAVMDAYLAEGK